MKHENASTPAIDLTSLKKQIAGRRNREAALSVIVPRLLGALVHSSNVEINCTSCSVVSGGFVLLLDVCNHWVEIDLRRDDGRWGSLFRCRLFSGYCGKLYNRRLRIIYWIRKGEAADWQEKIFDVFKRDSNWLLDLPQVYEHPLIVNVAILDLKKRMAAGGI
ncbi:MULTISPECIES: hypothetical protein [unclassified Mesorhizobium]|uniref:hypothetical protein n=1 Tax=unclassified Mesorhizobium TaxID=325217 RepID=UPI00333537E6